MLTDRADFMYFHMGIDCETDKAVFAILSLQYATGGLGFYRVGYTGPAFAFAGGLLPMLGALLE